MSKNTRISIYLLSKEGRLETKTCSWFSVHRTDDLDEAFNRAVAKHWGKRAWFLKDQGTSGESRWFGQIFKPLSQTGNYAVTGKIMIDFE